MRNARRLWIGMLAAASLAACTSKSGHTGSVRAAAPARDVTIMTFNVENLFDTADDPGKNDATYLPLEAKASAQHRQGCADIEVETWRHQCLELDWSEPVLVAKLEAVAGAILANGPDGRGPDIVVLQEVENLSVVERLQRDYLTAANYATAVLIDGDDVRGIDVAFLSRLPLTAPPVLHPVAYPSASAAVVGDTRGILEATFVLPDGQPLTGFAVHFPAPFHPAELRVQTYAALDALRDRLPGRRLAFAAGDFNTTRAEAWILDQHVAPHWTIAHREGCKDCPGTYYYARGDDWSFLDMILLSPSFAGATWTLDTRATDVARAWPAQVAPDGTPARFDPLASSGVSDHWPLRITLRANGAESSANQ